MTGLDYALIGALAGFLAGYLGIGGGLIIVPALSWLFLRNPDFSDVAVHMAVATSLCSMLFTSLSSIIAHHRKRKIFWNTVLRLTPGLLAGSAFGALLALQLPTRWLSFVFGLYALAAGMQLLWNRQIAGHKPLPGALGMTASGSAFGTISSLVGIGGGSMIVPWLLWHGRAAGAAVATASACGYPIAVAATLAFLFLGDSSDSSTYGLVHWPALLGISLLSVITAPLGAYFVHKSPPALVKRVFGVFLLLIALKMLI